jgi:hypothetical protein
MTIPEIQSELSRRHTAFCDFITNLSEDEFNFAREGKWTAGQQLDHIRRAVSLLPLGLRLPTFVRRLFFGNSSESLTYDLLVVKYKKVLEAGGKASGPFIPSPVAFSDRKKIAHKLQNSITKINDLLASCSESKLDSSRLPHPLLGKLTLREMMMFTVYHVDHHFALTKRNLENVRKPARTVTT